MPALRLLRQVFGKSPSSEARDLPPPTIYTAVHVLRVLLGIFLLTAAGLKIHGLFFDPSAQESILSSPRIQVATIEVEILLGWWLLSGRAIRAAWTVTLVFFGILASASLYLALAGQTSCGCFGRVAVNPWITFAIDVSAVAALLLCRPRQSHVPQGDFARWVPGLVKTGVGAAAFFLLIAGGFLLAFDNPADALARLRGESLTVDPSVSEVGEAVVGTRRPFTVRLVNHTDRPIRVVGGTATCGCIATNDLPIIVPPHDAQPIEVQMTFRGGAGRFQHRFVLYTDDEQQRTVVARFAGHVVEPSAP